MEDSGRKTIQKWMPAAELVDAVDFMGYFPEIWIILDYSVGGYMGYLGLLLSAEWLKVNKQCCRNVLHVICFQCCMQFP